jgi:phosphoglycerate dehydrogenase-like enzyme
MTHKVGFFLRANEDVYGVIRSALPEDMSLITLAGSDPQEEVERIRDLDFLISVRATREMIRAARKLRFLQLPGVGQDQVDLEAAALAGIPVALCAVGVSDTVSEHTMMLMLAVAKRVVELSNSLREGKWLMWERRMSCYNLKGKTLGIIGMGRIGKEVAARAAAFGMSIQYYDVTTVEGYRFCPLEELLRTSDFVTIHCPLGAETRGLLDRPRLALMKPEAILINAARGGIVDEAALCDALAGGRLAGAGLDVFTPEPPAPANPLLHMHQVVATPHTSGGTIDSMRVRAAFYAENIRRVLAGQSPLGLIPQASSRS